MKRYLYSQDGWAFPVPTTLYSCHVLLEPSKTALDLVLVLTNPKPYNCRVAVKKINSLDIFSDPIIFTIQL